METSNESENFTDLKSLRLDALAWAKSLVGSGKTEYQNNFYDQQYNLIFNKVTNGN